MVFVMCYFRVEVPATVVCHVRPHFCLTHSSFAQLFETAIMSTGGGLLVLMGSLLAKAFTSIAWRFSFSGRLCLFIAPTDIPS